MSADRRPVDTRWSVLIQLYLLSFGYGFATWQISLPLYLVSTRGWRGLGWALVHAVGLAAVTFVAQIIAAMVYLAADMISNAL